MLRGYQRTEGRGVQRRAGAATGRRGGGGWIKAEDGNERRVGGGTPSPSRCAPPGLSQPERRPLPAERRIGPRLKPEPGAEGGGRRRRLERGGCPEPSPSPPQPPPPGTALCGSAQPFPEPLQNNATRRCHFSAASCGGGGGGGGEGEVRYRENRTEPHRERSGSRPRAEAAFPPEKGGGETGTVTAGKCVGRNGEPTEPGGEGGGEKEKGGGRRGGAPQVPTAAPAVTDRRAALRPPLPLPPTPAPGSGAAGPAHAVRGGRRLRMARSFRADRAAERSRTGPGRAAQGRKRRAPPGGPRPALLPASPRWRHRERRRRQRGADARPRGGGSPPPEGSGRAGGNPPRGAAASHRHQPGTAPPVPR